MAEMNDFIISLEKELTCSICDDIFTQPKTLRCLHSFCFLCIKKWSEICKKRKQRLVCPVCRSRDDNDVEKFPSSFYLDSLKQLLLAMKNRASKPDDKVQLPKCVSCQEHTGLVAFCSDCEGMICTDCVDAHDRIKKLRDQHQVVMLSDFKQEHVKSYIANQIHCEEKYHEKHKLEYFCQRCEKCICQKCINTSHDGHAKISLEEKADEIKRLMNEHLHQVHLLKQKFVQELELSKKNQARVGNEIKAAKKTLSDHVQTQINTLKDHEITVAKTLDEMLLEQNKTSDEEQNEIETVIQQLNGLTDQVNALQDQNVDYIVLQSQLPQRCQQLFQSPSVLSSKPNRQRNASIRYLPRPEVTQSLQNLGKIEHSVTDPSRCSIEIESDVIRCGFMNHFEIMTRNCEDEVCQTSQDCIDVLIQDADGVGVEKELVPSVNGYIVTYKVPEKAPSLYEILVSIGGIAIKNSPVKVKTRDPKRDGFKPEKIFGEKGDGVKTFYNSQSLAVNDNNGEVGVVDYGNSRIVIFRSDGTYLRQFGQEGTDDGALCKPIGLVMYDNRIFVTDNPNECGRLQEFDANGKYRRTIYEKKGIKLTRMCLAGNKIIAVLWRNTDQKNILQCGIMLFSKLSGNLVRIIPVIATSRPFSIAYCNSKYFISFGIDHYISVFDPKGVFLYKFEEERERDGQFGYYYGLDIYDRSNLLVCDANNDRVQVFTQEGDFMTSFGRSGSKTGEMKHPIGIAVTLDGKVLVLEHYGNRIQVWQ